jgi:hypothetical protein
MRSKKQVYDRALSRMNTTDRRMTKALMGFRRKQTGWFSLSELSCLVLSGLAGRKGPDNDASMRIKGRKADQPKPLPKILTGAELMEVAL